MSRWAFPTEPPGNPGIDWSNSTQVQLIVSQKDILISGLRNRVVELSEAVEKLQRSMKDRNWQLSLLMEMIERSGIEVMPYSAAEAVALIAARTLLEAQRNKIIERVETTLGKEIEEENYNVHD